MISIEMHVTANITEIYILVRDHYNLNALLQLPEKDLHGEED